MWLLCSDDGENAQSIVVLELAVTALARSNAVCMASLIHFPVNRLLKVF